jgi:hypothetical protein
VEKRAGERFKVGNGFNVRVNLEEEFAVRDISIFGMCLECTACLVPDNVYHFELPFSTAGTLTTKGVVVRSFLKSMHGRDPGNPPLYHAGIEFIDLSVHEISLLEKLISDVIG